MPSSHAAWVLLTAVLMTSPPPAAPQHELPSSRRAAESSKKAPEPSRQGRPPRTCEGIKRVPTGEVRGGCDAGRRAECLGETVPGFEIDCGKVLRKSYQACVAQGACKPVPEQDGSPLLLGATYAQAARYCQWRQMRLPTEAEWERARAMEVLVDLDASSSA